jgi:hypothetical protein
LVGQSFCCYITYCITKISHRTKTRLFPFVAIVYSH